MNMDVSPMIGDGHGFGYLEKEKKPWMVVHLVCLVRGFLLHTFQKEKAVHTSPSNSSLVMGVNVNKSEHKRRGLYLVMSSFFGSLFEIASSHMTLPPFGNGCGV